VKLVRCGVHPSQAKCSFKPIDLTACTLIDQNNPSFVTVNSRTLALTNLAYLRNHSKWR